MPTNIFFYLLLFGVLNIENQGSFVRSVQKVEKMPVNPARNLVSLELCVCSASAVIRVTSNAQFSSYTTKHFLHNGDEV